MRAHGLVRAGAMHKLAAFIDSQQPHVMGVCEIDAGDALALATRFAMQWAYRGRQALFWKAPFRAHAVHDRYLPVRAPKLFDRRGLLIVDADLDGTPCTLAATQLSGERGALVAELRFARTHLRGSSNALLFADMPEYRFGFTDLGFERIGDGMYVRGFDPGALSAAAATV